ncbi:MAG TPA: hypothetical protein VFE18_11910 [Phenylobacterium sp.]|jgi:hypothetical protein|nr:hypothetical protein [Phenylobacterium sp.]
MSTSTHDPFTLASASYAALRYEGAPPWRAQAALALPEATAARLERLFRARPGGGTDPMKPAFARHAVHVRAVRAQGGFPALPDRPR